MTEEMNTEMLEDFVYPKMNEVYTGTVMKVDRRKPSYILEANKK